MPKWTPGMPSPNPSGRPRGLVEKRARVTVALLKDAERIAKVVSDAALEKDMGAAALILARVVPVLKNQGERVQFAYDPTASSESQANSIIAAVAAGQLSVENGKALMNMLAAVVGFRDIDTFVAAMNAARDTKRKTIPGGVLFHEPSNSNPN